MNIESLKLVIDLNGDGSYSLLEISELLRTLYRLPGNLMVEGLGHIPYVSSLLGIEASRATGYGSFNGLLSISLSLLFWVAAVFAVLTLSSPDSQEPENHPATLAKGQGPALAQSPEPFTAYHAPSYSGPSFYGVSLAAPSGQPQSIAARTHTQVSRPALRARKVSTARKHHRHLTGYLARHIK